MKIGINYKSYEVPGSRKYTDKEFYTYKGVSIWRWKGEDFIRWQFICSYVSSHKMAPGKTVEDAVEEARKYCERILISEYSMSDSRVIAKHVLNQIDLDHFELVG